MTITEISQLSNVQRSPMNSIPFFNLEPSYQEIKKELEESVIESCRSQHYIGGKEVDRFERQFSHYVEANHCIGVGNGLSALHLALLACGIKPGDHVLVPSNTFIATWLAVSHCGAIPVPVEPDPDTHLISADLAREAITDKTRAIIPVHLYGQSADLTPIMTLAKKHQLLVIEDAAQAQGAGYQNKRIGTHSDAVAWSFYPGKNLGAFGDAGAVTTNNEDIASQVRLLGNYGSRERYHNEVIGFNSRLDPIQAAVLSVKLAKLDQWNKSRSHIARFYSKNINSPYCSTPKTPEWSTPVWHQYVIRSPYRDQLRHHLATAGIETLIHYPIPPHLQNAYKNDYANAVLPVAEQLANEILSLPIWPQLSTEQLEQITYAINNFQPVE